MNPPITQLLININILRGSDKMIQSFNNQMWEENNIFQKNKQIFKNERLVCFHYILFSNLKSVDIAY